MVSNKYLLIWSVINFSYLSRRPGYCLPNNLLRKHVFGPGCWECRDRRSCHWSQEAHRQTSSDQNVLQVERSTCVWGEGVAMMVSRVGGVLGKDKETQKSFQEIWGLSCCYWSIIASLCKGMLVSSSMEHSGSKSFAISGAPTEKLGLGFPRSSTKVGAETGYEITALSLGKWALRAFRCTSW